MAFTATVTNTDDEVVHVATGTYENEAMEAAYLFIIDRTEPERAAMEYNGTAAYWLATMLDNGHYRVSVE